MPSASVSRALTTLVLVACLLPLSACGDGDPTGPGTDPLLGTWQATSFVGEGTDVIAEGMTLRMTLTTSDTYTFVVTNDMVGICGELATACTTSGPVSHTATTLIVDAGTSDATTFSFQIHGNTMTWSGSLGGGPVSLAFTRVN
ncbi:MAG TPA: hypothetical protein VFN22_05820 [Gemmatimonadales bacterium]|nr:hypothetical protein [Gemmatimonadales bacterium]